MALVTYPAIPKKTAAVALGLISQDTSDSGAIRAVDAIDAMAYTVDIDHPLIDAAQRDTLLAFYTANQNNSTTVTVADGRTYQVLINTEPRIEVVTPLRFNLRASLPGNIQ